MDKRREDRIGAVDHAALRAFLQGRGLTAARVTEAIGADHGNRTRQQVINDLLAFLRQLPRA